MKVYLLSDYEENGSTNMVGTNDKDKVMDLMKSCFAWAYDEDSEELKKLLEEDKPSCSPYTLGKGWGGVQLHIIELQ